MKQATALLGLRAMAPIHVGSDDLRNVIDLAIQREQQNHWPVVFGSSVKGALREAALTQWGAGPDLDAVFGPANPERDNFRAGALLVNEMRLLALPVASLSSLYKWVTCPEALRRLLRDCRFFGIDNINNAANAANTTHGAPAAPGPVPQLATGEALSFNPADPDKLFLREYLFHKRSAQAHEEAIITLFAQLFGEDEAPLRERLLVISDARFGHMSATCTAITPHIALDANKTTKDGALWHEEALPSETLMYLPLASEPERLSQSQQKQSATAQGKAELMDKVLSLFTRPYLRVGGNETTGMGWFQVHIAGRGE
jgi:CRISPR-associated protein Cmr4